MVSTEKVSCIIFEIVWHWNLFTWIYSALFITGRCTGRELMMATPQ